MNDPEPLPGPLAAEARKILAAEADPEAARGAQRFFKPGEEVPAYGLRTPRLRQIERSLHRRVRKSWGVAEALAFCDHLLTDPHLEPKALGLLLLSRYWRSFDAALLRHARRWLDDDLCDSWAVTDLLSQKVLGPLLAVHPGLVEQIPGWASSPNRWVRRAGAVALTGAASRGEHLDTAYRVSTSLFSDEDHLVQKAAGWLLREAGVTDPDRLEHHLLRHGPAVPRTTLRYAIERFPKPRRTEILQRTRSPRESREGGGSRGGPS